MSIALLERRPVKVASCCNRDEGQSVKPLSLEEVLAQLDIQPFTPESVKAYKDSKAANSKQFYRRLGDLARLLFLAACTCLFVLLVTAGFWSLFGETPDWLLKGAMVTAAVLIVFWLVGVMTMCMRVNVGYWETVRLTSEAEKTLPTHALGMVQSTRALCPEAEFELDQMFVFKEEVDPFLKVRRPRMFTCYYVAVWDEPDFKQE